MQCVLSIQRVSIGLKCEACERLARKEHEACGYCPARCLNSFRFVSACISRAFFVVVRPITDGAIYIRPCWADHDLLRHFLTVLLLNSPLPELALL